MKIPSFGGVWRLDICEAAGGRFFLIEPRWGRQTVAQGTVSGRSSGPPSPRRPPWVRVPTNFHPLPQHLLGDGGEALVGGSKVLTD
ncbi:MAG TPA: hypothetical protein VMW38_20930, partial [Terriglobia bacterium]|nr:hypothetical protein [Terriglobia bacterium]